MFIKFVPPRDSNKHALTKLVSIVALQVTAAKGTELLIHSVKNAVRGDHDSKEDYDTVDALTDTAILAAAPLAMYGSAVYVAPRVMELVDVVYDKIEEIKSDEPVVIEHIENKNKSAETK